MIEGCIRPGELVNVQSPTTSRGYPGHKMSVCSAMSNLFPLMGSEAFCKAT